MEIYMVGGAVRDMLLGIKPKDVDYVVVGATPDEMLAQGFEQVGASFPVFLHPVTNEEYALARTERKTGAGYHGFTTDFNPSVTIEEDLRRRDLTINAMAVKLRGIGDDLPAHYLNEGQVIDPYGGRADLEAGVLRHVSEAFAEDPLRVLRVARFAARYGYSVAPETLALMKQLVQSGELNTVSNERYWKEMDRALTEKHPKLFFETLDRVGALGHTNSRFFKKLFPRKGQVYAAVERLASHGGRPIMVYGFASAAHELSTDELQKLKVPVEVAKLAIAWRSLDKLIKMGLFTFYHSHDLVRWFKQVHTDEQFGQVLECLLVDCPNDGGKLFVMILSDAYAAYKGVKAAELMQLAPGLQGPALGKAIDDERARQVFGVFESYLTPTK